jgi:hypothetical protein
VRTTHRLGRKKALGRCQKEFPGIPDPLHDKPRCVEDLVIPDFDDRQTHLLVAHPTRLISLSIEQRRVIALAQDLE